MADDPLTRLVTTPAPDQVVSELERALASARAQQALLRVALGRVIEQLEPPSGG